MEAIGPNIPWTLSQVMGGKSFQLQIDLTSIAFRSNTSPMHGILRDREGLHRRCVGIIERVRSFSRLRARARRRARTNNGLDVRSLRKGRTLGGSCSEGRSAGPFENRLDRKKGSPDNRAKKSLELRAPKRVVRALHQKVPIRCNEVH